MWSTKKSSENNHRINVSGKGISQKLQEHT